MRRILRFLVLLLMFAALPIQGYAAATMVGCGAHHREDLADGGPAAVAAMHDQARHDLSASAERSLSHEVGSMVFAHHDKGRNSLQHGLSKCSACAACCVGVAIAPTLVSVQQQPHFGSSFIDFRPPHFYGFIPEALDKPPYRLIA